MKRNEIIKEIISYKINLYDFKILYQNRRKKFWSTYVAVSIGLLFYMLVSLVYQTKFYLFGTDNLSILGLCIFNLLLGTAMLKFKVKKPNIEEFYKKSDKELKEILKEVINDEKNFMGSTADRLANQFATTMIVMIALVLPLVVELFENDFDLTKALNIYSAKSTTDIFALLAFATFILGDFFSSLITPNKFEKRKNETIIKIKNSFQKNIYLSKLNPGLNDEKH